MSYCIDTEKYRHLVNVKYSAIISRESIIGWLIDRDCYLPRDYDYSWFIDTKTMVFGFVDENAAIEFTLAHAELLI